MQVLQHAGHRTLERLQSGRWKGLTPQRKRRSDPPDQALTRRPVPSRRPGSRRSQSAAAPAHPAEAAPARTRALTHRGRSLRREWRARRRIGCPGGGAGAAAGGRAGRPAARTRGAPTGRQLRVRAGSSGAEGRGIFSAPHPLVCFSLFFSFSFFFLFPLFFFPSLPGLEAGAASLQLLCQLNSPGP